VGGSYSSAPPPQPPIQVQPAPTQSYQLPPPPQPGPPPPSGSYQPSQPFPSPAPQQPQYTTGSNAPYRDPKEGINDRGKAFGGDGGKITGKFSSTTKPLFATGTAAYEDQNQLPDLEDYEETGTSGSTLPPMTATTSETASTPLVHPTLVSPQGLPPKKRTKENDVSAWVSGLRT